ncbi:hypothetical protein IAQ61_003777 [Plenodomus lingam]|uniref:Predicted protein n=1 Tax=Leptosphaeria maculans (strain JN3 / isolate v23.1.3 / race Av1-4-5-6-7-8) TaxID=985895 RepID=E4ZRQ5_LEPMJ|nr:predicted protein [Plenodomus lingam JN3]KAH9874588.1 hypothetical protein IAQ61_003777 [Plenodomus lingam]CBX93902.1 predicted protein [Plenodomus lingam JN3]
MDHQYNNLFPPPIRPTNDPSHRDSYPAAKHGSNIQPVIPQTGFAAEANCDIFELTGSTDGCCLATAVQSVSGSSVALVHRKTNIPSPTAYPHTGSAHLPQSSACA